MKRIIYLLAALGLFLFVQTAQADWLAAKRLTWSAGTSFNPAVAVDSSGNIYVAWQDTTPGNYEIFYKKSTDGGATWTAAQRLTVNSGMSLFVSVACEASSAVHLAWEDLTSGNSELFYMKSTDGGATWTPEKRLTWNTGRSTIPTLAVDSSGNPHLVWMDDTPGDYEIYYRKSTDKGNAWTPIQRLTWNTGESTGAALAVGSSGHLHLVWDDSTLDNYEIYYKRSTDGGATWTASKRLTWNSGNSLKPVLAADSSGQLHVFWHDQTHGNEEIYYKKSTDGGATWTANKRLTWNSGNSSCPAVAVDSNGVHVVYHDWTPGNAEVYYRNSPDWGETWAPSQRLAFTAGTSANAEIGTDPWGNLHVVWNDATPGNIEIYYKKYAK